AAQAQTWSYARACGSGDRAAGEPPRAVVLARVAGGAARPAVAGAAGLARGRHAGGPGDPPGAGLREDRGNAGGDRPVHDATSDGRVRRPRLLTAPGRRRGLGDRRPAHRRAAAAGPAGPTRIPRQLPVADRSDRIPRRCWHPGRCNSVLVKSPSGHWHPIPVRPGARTEDGLAVYRFGTDLYYANAPRLADDVRALTGQGGPLRWVVLDSAAIGDVDYTAGSVLIQVIEQLHQRHIRFVVTSMLGPVRRQLDRYGVGGPSGPDAYFETPGEALEAFHAVQAPAEARPGQ